MELSLELWPIHVVATYHQRLKLFPFLRIFQELGNAAKVTPRFVLGVTLRMSAIVAGISIAAPMSRCRVFQAALIFQLFKLQFRETGRLPVN